MDVWPLGAAGGEQHWSCQTGWGGCIRSSSPSSGVNRRSGTFTQPLTYAVTSEVMIKVRGQPGPLWSGGLASPSCRFLLCRSVRFFLPLSPSSPICLSIAHTLLHWPGPIETSPPLGVQKGKQEKINREDEWRPGGPIKNWMLLSVLVWFTRTQKHTETDRGRSRKAEVNTWKMYKTSQQKYVIFCAFLYLNTKDFVRIKWPEKTSHLCTHAAKGRCEIDPFVGICLTTKSYFLEREKMKKKMRQT